VRAVVFTSDGHTLATASDDATVILWDVSDLDRPRRLGDPLTHAAAVRSLAFTPDGRTLAAGSADGTAVLWDLSDLNRPRRMGKPLTGRTQGLTPVAFAPDGHTLAVGSEDGTAQMWDVGGLLAARDDAPSQACLITGGGLDGDQWARYLPDLSHEDSCTPA
jgi:WD40 repeat protein